MSDRYESQGAALIQFYGWLRETGEIDRLVDLVIEKVRDSRQTERAKDPESGCEQFRREPTREEMDRALGTADEMFYDGWTVRRCIDCRTPVAGGPTRCLQCVGRLAAASRLAAALDALREIEKKTGPFADMSHDDFPYVIIIDVGRIARAALAGGGR